MPSVTFAYERFASSVVVSVNVTAWKSPEPSAVAKAAAASSGSGPPIVSVASQPVSRRPGAGR